MIDGAHAPGMIPLDLNELNPPFYTGNCHKWMCTPKGSAFLNVREDFQEIVKPLVTSRRYGEISMNLSEFQYDFSRQGLKI
jgi:isopenicillin-N epimerase